MKWKGLYNNVLAGMAQDGKSFFYVNPLEVVPEACEKNRNLRHVKPERQKWFSCACCPPNIVRLISSLGQYIYTNDDENIFVHLYIGSEAELKLSNKIVKIRQTTNYPWDGNIKVEVKTEYQKELAIFLRKPGWCSNYTLKINNVVAEHEINNGYICIKKAWRENDIIELSLEMTIEFIQANPKVRHDAEN